MRRWLPVTTLIALLSMIPMSIADSSFDAFWVQFKTAVSKKDKSAVASMTKLPYLLDSKQLNKSEFIARYNSLFPDRVARCFAKAKPLADHGSYMVFCGEEIFVFAKSNGKWKFTEIGVND